MTADGPPPRHLHPVEPPFDPELDNPRGRPARHNLTAERAVLGHLLTTPTLTPTLSDELEALDFYNPHNGTIWDTICDLHAEGTTPDHLNVVTRLALTKELDRIGGDRYLLQLRDAIDYTADPKTAAREIRDTARLRTLANTATKLNQLAHSAPITEVDAYLADAVQALDDTVQRFGPRDPTQTTTGLKDLSWLLSGQPPTQPPPVYGVRQDGHALFYAGKVNGLIGDPETAKTWLAQIAIIEALQAGHTAAMIDVDHNGPDHTAARLALLGARLEHLANPERFRYYEPEDGEELRAAVTELTTWSPHVLVVDSIGEIFPMLGVNTNDGDEITGALRTICTRPAATGTCVITIDHLPKSHEARSTGFAIGSIAKKRMIRGSYLRVDAKVKPVPGGTGIITLRIEKDTNGELRKSSGGGYAGTLTLDSTQPHVTTWTIGRDTMPTNDDGTMRPTSLMERISRYVEDNDQANFRDIKEAITAKDKWLRDAIHLLVVEGFVARLDGPRGAKLHHCIAPYRETEDDHVATPN